VATRVPAGVKILWKKKLGGTLSAATTAGGFVFVADRAGQQVHALDAKTGDIRWTFAAGGPVSAPPTVHEGFCYFGCQDGWVYCVNATDGRLAWRFRAAPMERRIVCEGRLESAWPVHGSILIEDDAALFGAGRHSELDGGCLLYSLKLENQWVNWRSLRDAKGPARCGPPVRGLKSVSWSSGGGKSGAGMTADIATGKPGPEDKIRLTAKEFSSPIWAHRMAWNLGGIGGSILVFDKVNTYGIRTFYKGSNKHNLKSIGTDGYQLFAVTGHYSRSAKKIWETVIRVRTKALVKTADIIFGAGSPDSADEKDPWAAIDGKMGGRLVAYSAETGDKLSEMTLDGLPVPDGLIAANGRLYMSMKDGTVACLGSVKD
jgi:outer membrane protein assembly factor BamB